MMGWLAKLRRLWRELWHPRRDPSRRVTGPPSPPSPGPHIAVYDATDYGLGEAVTALVPAGWHVDCPPWVTYAEDARCVIVLLPVGPGAATDGSLDYLSALALAHEESSPVPVVITWCVPADKRSSALLGTSAEGQWVNELGLGRANAWLRVRAAVSSDDAGIGLVTRRMRRLLSLESHHAALAGHTRRMFSYADRASAKNTLAVPLVGCGSTPGAWHGHEMLAAAMANALERSVRL